MMVRGQWAVWCFASSLVLVKSNHLNSSVIDSFDLGYTDTVHSSQANVIPSTLNHSNICLAEGDIIVPCNRRQVRQASTSAEAKWDRGVVPYVIEGRYRMDQIVALRKTMRFIESNTCIKFVPYVREVHENYVKVLPVYKFCGSHIGCIGGPQVLSLQSFCFTFRTLVHELFHTLGFFHEQNDHNRDKYVKIHWENISPEGLPNFFKYPEAHDYGVGYDYLSIMHYGPRAFTKNGGFTISPTKNGEKYKYRIGQSKAPSKKDLEKLNRMYRCKCRTVSNKSKAVSAVRRSRRKRSSVVCSRPSD